MKLFSLSILLLFCVLLAFGTDNQNISITKVTPEGGVSYTSVMCIEEDEFGFIWFGTNNGLFSYNTIEIKKYSHYLNDSNSIATNRINKLYTDFSGTLWIATENGLCSYNRKKDNFNSYLLKDTLGNFLGKDINSFLQADDGTYWLSDGVGFGTVEPEIGLFQYRNLNSGIRVRTVSKDKKGTIWVFFANGDIYYLSKGNSDFQYFTTSLSSIIRSVLIDETNLWIGYESNGLICLNLADATVKMQFTTDMGLPSNEVRSIIKTKNNKLWVATYQGVAIIEDFKVRDIINEEKYPQLPNHSIWSLFQDSQENVWIGTWLGGLCFHSKYSNSFFHYTQSTSSNSLSYNVVSSITQNAGQQEVVIGTEDGNLNYFNTATNTFSKVPVESKGIKTENIKSITYDNNETLWVGTYGDGVFYRKKSDLEFHSLITDFSKGIQALSLLSTEKGIWVCDYPLGAYFYNFKSKEITRYRNDPTDPDAISSDNVRQILEDKNGNLWFATQFGLNFLENGSDKFVRIFRQENNANSISSNFIFSIHEDNDGFLWLGTNGQGLDKFDPKTHSSENYSTKDGLPGNEIYSILQDEKQNLWLTTDHGLCRFNPKTKESKTFSDANGINNNRFNPNASLVAKNGELYFGGTNGLIRFVPSDMKTNINPPTTIITNFYIHNNEILADEKQSILKHVIGKTRSLKLDYKQNSIGFRFVATNYKNPGKNRFKYRLTGFVDEWTETDNIGRATFTNIPSGTYTFEVKAANNDGIWNETPTQITIHVSPPFWKSWYAWFIYAFALVVTILYFRRQVINKQKLRNEIELEKVKRENEDALHQMKLQFFTNISHEFRTPLSLIQGPVNRMLASNSESETSNKQLKLIKNNTDRLLRLINQFLDFRKIDSGKLKLSPVNTDIISFCKNIFSCFEEHAKHRSMKFYFKPNISNLKIDFDPDKLDKILFNVLSNAFKNTSDSGTIIMEIENNKRIKPSISGNNITLGKAISDDYVEICVTDSGSGIPKDKLPQIFERYFQTESNSAQGTGIGLSLSKNYVLLHKGQLVVHTKENFGTAFSIFIPQHQHGTLNENHINQPSHFKSTNFSVESISTQGEFAKNPEKSNNQEALVLIAEDNSELLNYLSELLQEHFRVAKARNGKEALEQTNLLFPDLVISDIMMPEMDGITLCETLKNDIRTSHTPVILLTALDTIKDKISGLQSGADAYIPKPFDDNLLLVQINNLLESRIALRESFSSEKETWKEKYSTFDLDKKLLLKAIQVIESNLSNDDLTVEILAAKLNLSRTHLHRKLKALTNKSATDFIRSVRLKHAIKLLQEGQLKVNEIGYAVGFSSHNYFSRSFKKQYGKSPSEYLKDYSQLAQSGH